MRIRVSLLTPFVVILAFLTGVLGGCASSGSGAQTSGSGTGSFPSSQPVSGMLVLPKAMSAGTIAIVARQADGSVFDSTVTSPNGWYQVRGGFDGRVEALLPDGTLLAAEVRQASSDNVNISFPTTIVSRYAQSNPQLSLAEVEARVKTSLGVPARINLQDAQGDSWRPFFSATAFTQAAGATPINTFINQAVARARNGGVQAFRIPHPYPMLFRSLHPQEAAYYQIQAAAPAKTGARVAAAGSTNDSLFSQALSGIASNAMKAGTKFAVGWTTQKLGIGSSNSAAAEYAQILAELQQLQNQINNLQTTTVLQTEITAANTYASTLLSKFSTFNTYLQQNDAAGAQQAATLLNSYVNPANGAQVVTDVNGVVNYLLGTTGGVSPMGPLYASILDNSTFGSKSPAGDTMFMDVRNNDALDQVATLVDYYLGAVQLGAIMQTEYAHLDPNTFNTVFTSIGNANIFASNLQAGQNSVYSVAANLTSATQLTGPPTIASDSLIAFPNGSSSYGHYGYLMYTPIQGPCTWDTAVNNASKFVLGPWGSGGFEIAPLYVLEALRGYASNLGNGDVNKGLYKMGILKSDTTDKILIMAPNGDNFFLYDITNGKTPQPYYKDPYNYLLVHFTPAAPSEDLGTVLATLYPGSTSTSGATVTNAFFEALTCLGLYSFSGGGGTFTPNISPAVTWSSSNTAQATVANYAATSGFDGSGNGVVTFHQPNATATITAQLCTSLNGSPGAVGSMTRNFTTSTHTVTGTAQAPVLTSILVSPINQNYATLGGGGTLAVNCYATGFYSDNTVKDLTNQVTWSLTSTSGLATFDATVRNQLNLVQAEGSDTINITATFNSVQGQGTVTTSFIP